VLGLMLFVRAHESFRSVGASNALEVSAR